MYQPSGTSSNINIRVRTYARELQANLHTHAHTDFYTLTFHTQLHRAQLTGSTPSKGHAFATRKTRRTPSHAYTQQQIERQRNLCPLRILLWNFDNTLCSALCSPNM